MDKHSDTPGRKLRPLAQALLVDRSPTGEWRRYSGTRDQLIAAGLGLSGDFPGDPNGPAASRTVERDGKRFHFSVHSRAASPMTFWVSVSRAESREELRQRRLREAAKSDAQFDRDHPELARKRRERRDRDEALKRAIRSGEDVAIGRVDEDWGAVWTGRRADLLAANVCGDGQFPDGRKHAAYGKRFDIPTPNADRWMMRRIALDCFDYTVYWSDEERERRRVARMALKQGQRPAVYCDATAFAEHCERGLRVYAQVTIADISGDLERSNYGNCTISYDDETVRNIAEVMEHARQLLQAATPRFTRKEPRQVEAARADLGFRQFMSKIARK